MDGLNKKVEMVANLAIILVAVALVGVLAYKFWGDSPQVVQQVKVGEKINIKNTDWTNAEQTLILVLQKNCHFCTESIGFYKKLVETAKSRGKTKLIAVFPTSVDDSAKYLSEQGLNVDEVKQVGLSEINVRGTPTILLVDKKGKVKNLWVGKLSPENESEVVSKL